MAKLKSGTRIYGTATIDTSVIVGSAVTLSSSGIQVSGISTLGVTSATNLTSQQLSVSGITTLGVTSTTNLTSQQINVSGITTLGVTSTTNLTSQQLNVSGITTLGITSATNLTSQQLNVSGITTLGITSATNLTSQQLSVSGISTFVNGPILVGTGTSTGTASQPFQVTGGAYVSGNLGIGTTTPAYPLQVQGNARVTGAIYDSTNAPGTTGQVLQSTITGTLWATAAAGGSGTFDTGITTTTFVSVDSGIGTAITGITTVQANNDIFLGPGIALSFPNVVGNRYVIQSIHVANIFDNELYLTARHDFKNGQSGALKVPIANRLVVPYNGALELLEQPTVANPGDILRLQALSGIGTTAGGVDGGLDAWITYSTKTDTNFVGVGTTVTTAGTNVGGVSTYQTVYTSTGFPSVIQSIRIANYNLFIDVDASIAIFSSLGIRKGHLAYNLTIPKNSIVELCQQPKRLQASETLGVSVGSTTSGGANCLSVFVSSKYITS
jgi:hypothetical protein